VLQTNVNGEQMVAIILQTKGYGEFVLVFKPAIWRIRKSSRWFVAAACQPVYHTTPFRLHFF